MVELVVDLLQPVFERAEAHVQVDLVDAAAQTKVLSITRERRGSDAI